MEYTVKATKTIEAYCYIEADSPKEAKNKYLSGGYKPYNTDVTSVVVDIKAHGMMEKVEALLNFDWESRVTLVHEAEADKEFVILRFKQSGILWTNELKNILSHYGGFLSKDGGIVGLTIYEKKKGNEN